MEKIENIKSPFMCYCAKVIPLAFDESMSYYETLCNFYNYLKNEVMKVINNNAEATKELQDKMIELKNYIDHYFDDLNITEQINAKLDEMVESGEMETIIAQYLQLEVGYIFKTIDDMQDAENLFDSMIVKTSGFYEYNDNGGAYYYIRNKESEEIADNIHTFDLHDETLIAELLQKDSINLKQLGVSNDNDDNYQRIIYAITNFQIINVDEDINVENTISLSNLSNKIINGNKHKLTIDKDIEHDLMTLTNCNNITINELYYTNGETRISSEAPQRLRVLYINNSNYINIYNCKFYDLYNCGVQLENSGYINIENSIFKNGYYDLLTILQMCHDINVNNNIFDTVNSTYDNSYLIATGSYNFSETYSYNTKNITISNNKVMNNPNWEGIDTHGCIDNFKCINNYVYNTKVGIYVKHDVRFNLTNDYMKNVIIENNYIENPSNSNTIGEGIIVSGKANVFASDIIIKNNKVVNYGGATSRDAIQIEYAKNFTCDNNMIEKFNHNGIQCLYSINGQITNNYISHPLGSSCYGILMNINCWLVNVYNNNITGDSNYQINRGVVMSTLGKGLTCLGRNNIYNYATYRYTSGGSNNTIIGAVGNTTPNRVGVKGYQSIDQNDIIKSYCTDDVVRSVSETISGITITANAGDKLIQLPDNESVIAELSPYQEIVIPGAGTSGDDLTVTITDIIGTRYFYISETIKTSISNVHPDTTASTWVVL